MIHCPMTPLLASFCMEKIVNIQSMAMTFPPLRLEASLIIRTSKNFDRMPWLIWTAMHISILLSRLTERMYINNGLPENMMSCQLKTILKRDRRTHLLQNIWLLKSHNRSKYRSDYMLEMMLIISRTYTLISITCIYIYGAAILFTCWELEIAKGEPYKMFT